MQSSLNVQKLTAPPEQWQEAAAVLQQCHLSCAKPAADLQRQIQDKTDIEGAILLTDIEHLYCFDKSH